MFTHTTQDLCDVTIMSRKFIAMEELIYLNPKERRQKLMEKSMCLIVVFKKDETPITTKIVYNYNFKTLHTTVHHD